MKLWHYVWISVIHAVLKLEGTKHLELITCLSRATSKYVEGNVGVSESDGQCLSTPFVF